MVLLGFPPFLAGQPVDVCVFVLAFLFACLFTHCSVVPLSSQFPFGNGRLLPGLCMDSVDALLCHTLSLPPYTRSLGLWLLVPATSMLAAPPARRQALAFPPLPGAVVGSGWLRISTLSSVSLSSTPLPRSLVSLVHCLVGSCPWFRGRFPFFPCVRLCRFLPSTTGSSLSSVLMLSLLWLALSCLAVFLRLGCPTAPCL